MIHTLKKQHNTDPPENFELEVIIQGEESLYKNLISERELEVKI